MRGDIDENSSIQASQEELPDWNSEVPTSNCFNVDDPSWCRVVGIYESKRERRFIRKRDLSSANLRSIIQRYVEPGSVIDTDMWCGYNPLCGYGYVNDTVEHSDNYVNPDT